MDLAEYKGHGLKAYERLKTVWGSLQRINQKSEMVMERALDVGETVVACGAVAYANAAFSDDGIAVAYGGVDADVAGAAVLGGAALAGFGGKHSAHLFNIAKGAGCAWAARQGTSAGLAARQKAGKAMPTLQVGSRPSSSVVGSRPSSSVVGSRPSTSVQR